MSERETAPRRDSAAALPTPNDENSTVKQAPACSFCDRPATATCRRCGRQYCPAHGGAFCQECSDPASALPSPRLFRAVLLGLPVFALAGVVLLFAAPRLPGEYAAPAPATATVFGPGSLPSATATPAGRIYAVQRGDTLQSIATRNGTTVAAILQLNPGITPDNLPVGQILRLPAPTPTPTATTTP